MVSRSYLVGIHLHSKQNFTQVDSLSKTNLIPGQFKSPLFNPKKLPDRLDGKLKHSGNIGWNQTIQDVVVPEIITACQQSCGKLMFSFVSVHQSVILFIRALPRDHLP